MEKCCKFIVKTWSNGGSTFGIRFCESEHEAFREYIKKCIASERSILIKADDDEFRVEITDGFFKNCRELWHKKFKSFFERHGIDKWIDSEPHTLILKPYSGCEKFELSIS